MEKILEVLKKREFLIVLLIIIISITTFSFNKKMRVDDELWTFSNIYKLLNGFKIYKDVNVITTPLFFFMGTIIFKLFSANYLVYRIYNVFIFIIFYMTIYLIFTEFKMSKKNKMIYLMIMFLLTYRIISAGANYNMLALVLYILGIYFMLKEKQSGFTQGIIIFLILITKQNVGALYIAAYAIYTLINNRSIKKIILEVWKSVLILLILSTAFTYILYTNGILYNFIDLAILGLREFQNNNAAGGAVLQMAFVIILLSFSTWLYKSKILILAEDDKKKILTLLVFGFLGLLISYPIVNKYHMCMSAIIPFITFIVLCDKGFLEKLTNNENIEFFKIIVILSYIVAFIIINAFINTKYIKEIKEYGFIEPYYGATFDEDIKQDINTVIKYINKTEKDGKQVKIISYYADMYINPLKENNGIMDLPFLRKYGKKWGG